MIVIGVPTTGAIPTRVVGSIENVLLNRTNVAPYYVTGSLVYSETVATDVLDEVQVRPLS